MRPRGPSTIAALAAAPYGVPADHQFKTLVYMGDGRPFLVILRGSDELEEAKLGALGFTLWRPATPEEIEPLMGAKPGSLGAVRGTIPGRAALAGIFADQAIRLVGNGDDRRKPGRGAPAQCQRGARSGDHPVWRFPAGARRASPIRYRASR